MSRRDDYTPVASEVFFDNSNSDYTAEDVESALKQVSEIVEGDFDFSNATSFQVFVNDTVNSTTSVYPNFVTKLSGTSIDNTTGKYVINWYCELTNSGNNNITWFKVQWKPTTSGTWLNLTEIDILIPRGDSYIPVSGFKTIDLASTDTVDLRIQFCTESATARIRNSNVYLFRVAT